MGWVHEKITTRNHDEAKLTITRTTRQQQTLVIKIVDIIDITPNK